MKDIQFERQHDFFVGIDSDGCVFDTMEVKQKECFIPNIIEYYQLAAVSKYARECAEFVNLYSKDRGINRFPALLKTFELLAERPEVQTRDVVIPDLTEVAEWIQSETRLGNPALQEKVELTKSGQLRYLLDWSVSVNDAVERIVRRVPPFPKVRESLQKLAGKADVLVVSATPNEALRREWEEHDLASFVAHICGQEVGTKKEILYLGQSYEPTHRLMVGDAPGDYKAAQANDCLFYPVLPGREDASWQRFHDEAIDRFLSGTYAGEYEQQLLAEFDAALPSTPPWKQ